MEGEKRKRMGMALGAIGLLILTLNLADFYAGWNALADETALAGIALSLAGAYFALIRKKEEITGG